MVSFTTPTGNVRFRDGSTVLGTNALSSGVADFTTTHLNAVAHTIYADYLPDSGYFTASTNSLALGHDGLQMARMMVAFVEGA